MLNPYVEKLIEVSSKDSHDLKEVKDQWRTPDPEFFGIEQFVCGTLGVFMLDLFTDGQNSKCDDYYTALDNALTMPWHEDLTKIGDKSGVLEPWAFANPPYSRPFEWNGAPHTGMAEIMRKAAQERDKGARICFLVKSASSESWWPDEISEFPADRIINIKGRLSFELPVWCKPKTKKTSAGFGGTLLIFNKHLPAGELTCRSVSRKTLVDLGSELAETWKDKRKEWEASFEDL